MSNKTVLITGTSKGIGQSIEKILVENGYKVFGCGRSLLEKENYLSVDLTTKEGCENLVKKAKEYLGNIDILINNAGEYIYSEIQNIDYETIERVSKLNFFAPYYLSSLLIPEMKTKNWGRIVNIGSISGTIGEAGATLYSATKSSFLGLTKALALEVATNNITVNTINPGWVDTELAKDSIEQSDFTVQDNLDVIPQKRFINPDEIANLVLYLISENAKGLTGQSISLCAGLSCG
ncbi:MAG: SDR family oxidoreductase [Cyanobacteria bacterium SIG30]|nr:SDR family oxidoreductase [Cyanobacteria bacterium SIG30]